MKFNEVNVSPKLNYGINGNINLTIILDRHTLSAFVKRQQIMINIFKISAIFFFVQNSLLFICNRAVLDEKVNNNGMKGKIQIDFNAQL